MTWEAWAALAIILAVLAALARNLAGPDVVLMGAVTVIMTLSLFSDRFPTARQSVAIFANEGLLTIAVLFVVAAALTETGALRAMLDRVLGLPRSVRAAQLRLMAPVMLTSAFLNNTAIVAMFMPVVNDWCKRARLSPSKLFIPLSYAAILGGVCTLVGTSTNLVVHGLMLDARRTDPNMPVLGMFTLTPIGVPIALLGGLYLLLASPRLLPERRSAAAQLANAREYTLEMVVRPGTGIDGKTIEAAGLRQLPGVYLAAIERNGLRRVPVPPDETLLGGDELTFVGAVSSVVDLQRMPELAPAGDQTSKLSQPRHNRILAEAVVSPACPLVGRSIREGRFRSCYEAVVLAVHRSGEHVEQKVGDIVLQAGDTLLLETSRRFIRQQRNSRDFFLVSDIPDSQPLRHNRAWVALLIMFGLVAVVAAEQFTGLSVFHAALIAVALMGVTGCLSAEQARRSIDWQTLISIAGALVVGRAAETSGLAAAGGRAVVGALAPVGPIGVLAAIYLLTLVCTEIVTNNAAAALAFPLAHAVATDMGVSFLPFAIVIAIAASSGFATPIGYQTHLMVYGAGGYRFGDYMRVGVPLDVLVMVVTIALAPLLFPF